MKPILLKMQAFGSFSDENVIDFRKFHNQPIFLIHGKTGAGKTTIFDAICYALYDETTGIRSYEQMRSSFASSNQRSFVEFIFQLKDRFYRIKREFWIKGTQKIKAADKPKTPKKGKKGEKETVEIFENEDNNVENNTENLLEISSEIVSEIMPETSSEIVSEVVTEFAQQTEKVVDKNTVFEFDYKIEFAELDAEFNQIEVFASKKKGEVKDLVQRLLGVSANQFRQIVILPQGKFSELLHAKDKTQLLTQIFNADIYQRITKNIIENASEYKKEYERDDNKVNALLSFVQCKNTEELDEKIQELAEMDSLETDIKTQEENYKKALLELNLAENILKEIVEFEQTQTKYIAHLDKENEFKNLEISLEKAQKAEKVKQFVENAKNASTKLETQKKKIIKLDKEIAEIQILIASIIEKVQNHSELSSQINNAKNNIEKYENLKPLINELKDLKKQVTDLTAEYENTNALIISYKEQKNQLEISQQKLKKEKESLQEVSSKEGVFELELKQFEDKSKRFGEYQQVKNNNIVLEKDNKKLFDLYEKINKERTTSQQDFERIEKAWRNNQAFVLAEKLIQNEPCMVCGSLLHPLPAHIHTSVNASAGANVGANASNEKISDEMLSIAQKNYEKAQKNYENALKNYQEKNNELNSNKLIIKSLEDNLGDLADMDENTFQNLSKVHQNNLKEAQNATKKLAKISTDLQKIETELIDNQKNKEIKDIEFSEISKKKDNQEFILNEKKKLLPTEIKSASDIDKLITKNQLQITENETVIKEDMTEREKNCKKESILLGSKEETILQKEIMETEVKENLAQLQKQLILQGFDDENAVLSAFFDEKEQLNIKQKIENWKQTKNSLETTFNLQKQKIENVQKPDLQLLKSIEKEKKQLLENLQTAFSDKKALKTNLLKQKKDLAQFLEKATESKKIFEEINELSKIANGTLTGVVKQKFESYVLAVFLEEVIMYANRRLEVLSQGRYQLFRKDIASLTQNTTLDFEILDTTVGVYRDVSTLSGGETFFTSLALALGLADIASSKKGAFKLDAVFIDEGFGTLDAETLDLAIRTLVDLEGGSRMIGIISHVAELKERIEAKLEVVKGKNGSKIV